MRLRLVYVFDCMQAEGYAARVPEFLARIWIRRSGRALDYWTCPCGNRQYEHRLSD